jgi:hypothetical protein
MRLAPRKPVERRPVGFAQQRQGRARLGGGVTARGWTMLQ